MSKEKQIQEYENKQLIDELSKMPPMVIATAYLHAINYTLYGEDVTEKWITATKQAAILAKAYRQGYYDALQRQKESEEYMTEIIAKPFDWNDNLSKEAIEDFEGIRKDLPYCTCQNIGMALAKLELLEKQGCKVIDPSGSSSEKPNRSEWEQDHEILKAYSDGANDVLGEIKADIEQTTSRYCLSIEHSALGHVVWSDRLIKESEVLEIIDKYKAESEET